MKKELFEVIQNNKLKTALGVFAAGLVLANCDVQIYEYYTLEQMRQQDNSPSNRYRVDYGGTVKWLRDTQTGGKWDQMGKKQCLANSIYETNKSFQYLDPKDILHVQAVGEKTELKFEGINNTTSRLTQIGRAHV